MSLFSLQSSLGPRSLTLLELTNKHADPADDSWTRRDGAEGQPYVGVGVKLVGGQTGSGPEREAANERIVKKGLMWVQQDKLFSRWKEMMILVNKWAITKDLL